MYVVLIQHTHCKIAKHLPLPDHLVQYITHYVERWYIHQPKVQRKLIQLVYKPMLGIMNVGRC